MRPEMITSSPRLTVHAEQRISQRRIPQAAVEVVLTYGRKSFTRGAQLRAIGRREVERFEQKGIDLRPYEGLQVILDPSGSQVITAYRNHDFRGLRSAG